MSLARVRDLCQEADRLHAAGRLKNAEDVAEAALAEAQTTMPAAHYSLPLAQCALAACKQALGDVEAARRLIEAALANACQLDSSDFEHARVVLTHAAEFYASIGDEKMRRQLGDSLIALIGDALGVDHPRYFAALAKFSAPSINSVNSVNSG